MLMNSTVREIGFWSGIAAALATVAFDFVQVLQIVGALTSPLDEILIYGTSMCIVVPFLLEMLAFHHLTREENRFWSHGALLFAVVYAVFVTPNYVTQLATVIPQSLSEAQAVIHILEQTPHSLFWNYDAIGYLSMGLAALMVAPALENFGIERRVKIAALAHALVTPLIGIVYFYPSFSTKLLFLGFPWAVTAPVFMTLMALNIRGYRDD